MGRPLGQVLRRRVVACCRLRVPCWRRWRWRGVAGARVADGRWRVLRLVGWCIGLRGRGRAGPATLQLLGRWVACGGGRGGGVSRVALPQTLRGGNSATAARTSPGGPAASPACRGWPILPATLGAASFTNSDRRLLAAWVHTSVNDRSGAQAATRIDSCHTPAGKTGGSLHVKEVLCCSCWQSVIFAAFTAQSRRHQRARAPVTAHALVHAQRTQTPPLGGLLFAVGG